MFSIIIMHLQLFMLSVTSWLLCDPGQESHRAQETPACTECSDMSLQQHGLPRASTAHPAWVLFCSGPFTLGNHPVLCSGDILLVWHGQVGQWQMEVAGSVALNSHKVLRTTTNVTTLQYKHKVGCLCLCLL